MRAGHAFRSGITKVEAQPPREVPSQKDQREKKKKKRKINVGFLEDGLELTALLIIQSFFFFFLSQNSIRARLP